MGYRKITIVGESNLCRSFIAETVLRGVLKRRKISDIEVISRGLVVLFSEPVSQMALTVLRKCGYEISEYRSSPLTKEDLESSDLTLTMTEGQAEKVKEEFGPQTACMSVSTFVGFEDEIPDMKAEEQEDFEKSFRGLESLMEAAADRIIGELLP